MKKSEVKAVATYIRTSKFHAKSNMVKFLMRPIPSITGVNSMNGTRFLVVMICSALLLGCSGKPQDLSEQVKASKNKSEFTNKKNVDSQSTPEFIASHTETPIERAHYLRGLTGDAKFDPKQHVEMLKKYENDPDSEVATAAKELLTKVQ
jgi:hypothetical protein